MEGLQGNDPQRVMMLAKVIGLSKGGIISAKKVLSYLGRDGADQTLELAQFGSPVMGTINLDVDVITAHDRQEVARLWDDMVFDHPTIRSNPFYHVSINWQEHEHPSAEQAQEACLQVMRALGMGECDAVWAIHRDTDNDHVHLVINRLRSADLKLVCVPAWDYLKLDKAMRELELKQQWAHSNGPWIALEVEGKTQIVRMGKKERRARGLLQEAHVIGNGSGLTQQAIRFEKNSGQDSFQRWIAGQPATTLKEALLGIHLGPKPSWASIHTAMAFLGLKIVPKGSGLIVIGERQDGILLTAKASQLGRFATKGALEKALGPYEPIALDLKLVTNAYTLPTDPHHIAPHIQTFKSLPLHGVEDRAMQAQLRAKARAVLMERFEQDQLNKRSLRIQLRSDLRQSQSLERIALRDRLRTQKLLIRRRAKATGQNVLIAISLFAFEAAKAREELLVRHAVQRKTLTTQAPRNQVLRHWLDLEAAKGDRAAQAALRGILYREQRSNKLLTSTIEGEDYADLKKMTFTNLHAQVDIKGRKIVYTDRSGMRQFTDMGPRIEMHSQSSESLEAALKLAAQKYGGKITLSGSNAFRERSARAATRLGIAVLDQDLAVTVLHEKRLSQKMAMKLTNPLDNTKPKSKKDQDKER